MAIDLRVSDGTTTAQLTNTSGGTYPALLEYTPQVPERDPRSITTEADGYEQPNVYWRSVTEQAKIAYTPGDMTTARAALVTLNRLFEQARRWQQRVGSPVYVKFRPDTGDTLYRSEILSGHASIDDQRYPWLTVTWTRRYYWETDSETQLNLYNTIQTTPGSTITLRNCFYPASSYSNVAKIQAASVTGDMPAAARVAITNLSAIAGSDYYLGHMTEGASTMTFNLEAEDGVNYLSSADTTSASYSGGAYTTLNNPNSTEMLTWSGTISAAMLAAAQGYRFRIHAMTLATAYTDLRARAKVTIDNARVLYESPYYITIPQEANVVDFGAVQLPPRDSNVAPHYPLNLEIYLLRSGGGSVPIDFFHLTPVMSYRMYKTTGSDLAQNRTINDDPTLDRVYETTASGNRHTFTASGSKAIMLIPNQINVLTLVHRPTDPFRQTRLEVYYRARRLQL